RSSSFFCWTSERVIDLGKEKTLAKGSAVLLAVLFLSAALLCRVWPRTQLTAQAMTSSERRGECIGRFSLGVKVDQTKLPDCNQGGKSPQSTFGGSLRG